MVSLYKGWNFPPTFKFKKIILKELKYRRNTKALFSGLPYERRNCSNYPLYLFYLTCPSIHFIFHETFHVLSPCPLQRNIYCLSCRVTWHVICIYVTCYNNTTWLCATPYNVCMWQLVTTMPMMMIRFHYTFLSLYEIYIIGYSRAHLCGANF